MSKVCECCRKKIEEAFRDHELSEEMAASFVDLIEKFASQGRPLPKFSNVVGAIEDVVS